MSVFVVVIPALFFFVGLGVMMRSENRASHRDDSCINPMFLRKKS